MNQKYEGLGDGFAEFAGRLLEEIGRGSVSGSSAWLDGTPDQLYVAAGFVQVLEERTCSKIAHPEEVAHRMGFISHCELAYAIGRLTDCSYHAYLTSILLGPAGLRR